MHTKRILICLATALIAATQAPSRPRTYTQKLSEARRVLDRMAGKEAVGTATTDVNVLAVTDAYTAYGSSKGGFVLVANDDRLHPVLAYSATPLTDGGPNPGFYWFLNCARQAAGTHSGQLTTPPDPEKFPTNQAPLLHTAWNQEAPYNWMCPPADYSDWVGYQPDAEHCAVGCVATAAAQLMNYYRYPEHGEGQNTVEVASQQTSNTYTVDFSTAHYDWDLMLDDYEHGYTEEQARAVAQLCYHVGVASQMGYSKDGSSTDNYYAVQALGKHFGYDIADVEFMQRDLFTEQEWMDKVYTELSQQRPILYEGVGVSLGTYGVYGHSFIVDGYDEDGLVHVNWGWGGRYDGYFDIALLNPRDLQFDVVQVMAVGISAPDFTPQAISQTSCTPHTNRSYTADGMVVNGRKGRHHGILIRNGKKTLARP